jgi:rhamnose transport system ATP-binding protein
VLDDKPMLIHGPAHARSLGIAVVHQEPRLFPDLTVAENTRRHDVRVVSRLPPDATMFR